MKKYFKVLKIKYEWNKLKRTVASRKRRELKEKYFHSFRSLVRNRIYCRGAEERLSKYKRKDTLRKHLNMWANEISEIFTIRNFTRDKMRIFS